MNFRTAASISRVDTPGRTMEPGQGPGLGGQPPGPAHPLDLARGFQGDHFHPHASNAFMTSTLVSSMVGWFSTGLRMPRWA